jgi:hypothetical protein
MGCFEELHCSPESGLTEGHDPAGILDRCFESWAQSYQCRLQTLRVQLFLRRPVKAGLRAPQYRALPFQDLQSLEL